MTTEQKDTLEADIQAQKDKLKEMKAKFKASKKARREARKKSREEEALRLEVELDKVQRILALIYEYKRLGKAAKKKFNILLGIRYITNEDEEKVPEPEDDKA